MHDLNQYFSRLARTKTIATVGPACDRAETLGELLKLGVDVFRLNTAHGDLESRQKTVDTLRDVAKEVGIPFGILVDLAGPKIRLGQLPVDPVDLETGSEVSFVRGKESSNPTELTCSYDRLIDEVKTGDQIMLTDGLVRLEVTEVTGDKATCCVTDGGTIRSRQGVNLPGVNLGIPALLDTDRANAIWAATINAEFVSLSFVRRASEITELKALLKEKGSHALVIAKIEKREALEDLDNIVKEADGIMVARGDLGVEIEIEKTPLAQKRIIKTCQNLGKPVIVATQMLESMLENRQPTRAEASDVANAILDGADACMLSGETAIGKYPAEAVTMMQKIKQETEQILAGRRSRLVAAEIIESQGVSEAVVFGAAQIAKRVNAKMVVIATSHGNAALMKSKQRDFIPTVAVTNNETLLNQMSLYWGITPVRMNSLDVESIRDQVQQWASEVNVPGKGPLKKGDRIVFVVDTEFWPGVNESVLVGEIK